MIRNILVICMLFISSPSVFAADQSTAATIEGRQSDLEATVCYDYDRNPRVCANLWYCTYDYRRGECNYTDDRGGGGGHGSYCSDYDGDRQGCSWQRDCEWNARYRTCDDAYNPRPNPASCNRYYDARSCESNRDCAWDRRLDRCVNYR